MQDICAYGLIGSREKERWPIFMDTIGKFEHHHIVEAIYPNNRKIPWLYNMLQASKSRCKRQLSLGELGAMLSHRKIWKHILKTSYSHSIILESDAEIRNGVLLKRILQEQIENYDVLFLGSYNGRTKLRRSEKVYENGYLVGIPLKSTCYCAYGYMVNKKACSHLLNATKKAAWPVDYWSEWLTSREGDWCLRVGAVVPEVISTWDTPSSIQDIQSGNLLRCKVFFVDLRNSVKAFFS